MKIIICLLEMIVELTATKRLTMTMCLLVALYSSRVVSAEYWTPAEITTLAWYDASDTTNITESAGAVSEWRDKSGNNLHLGQSTSGAQPQTGSRQQNSLNVLDFIEGDYLEKASFPVPASGDISIFVVAEIDVVNNAYDSMFSMDAVNDFQFDSQNTAQFNGGIRVSGIGSLGSLTGGPFAGPSIFNTVFDKTDVGAYSAYVDGTQRLGATTYSTPLDTAQIFRVMANRNTTQPLDGAVGEVVLVEDCSEATRQTIEGYLAWKWGLQSKLPTGHPFETARPDTTPPTLNSIEDDTGGSVEANSAVTYTLTFSENMLASSITADTFTNSAATSPSPIMIGTINPASATNVFTVFITPTAPGNLRLGVSSNVTDLSGNPMAGDTNDVDTITVTADLSPPTVSSIEDNQGGGTVRVGNTVVYTVTFNETIKGGTCTVDDFANPLDATVTINSVTPGADASVFTVSVTPTTLGELKLRVKSGSVTDLADNALAADADDNDTLNIIINPLTLYAAWDLNEGSGNTTTQYQLPSGHKWNQVINPTAALAATASADFSGLASWSSASPAPGSTGSLTFNGTQTIYQLDTNVDGSGLAGTEAKTLVAWINPTAADGGILSYSPTTGGGPGNDLRLLLDANGDLRAEVSSGYFIYDSTSLVGQGWKMVAAIFDGNTTSSKFYISGVGMVTPTVLLERSINTGSTSRNIVIGQKESADKPFVGEIDMAAIYIGAANEAQLDAIYANGISIPAQEGTLMLLF